MYMKIFIQRFLLLLVALSGTLLLSPSAHAGFSDAFRGISLGNLNGECLYDLDFGFRFSIGAGFEEPPVFGGPGVKDGAKIVRCKLDIGVSKEEDLKKLIIGWMNFLLELTALLAVVALVWAGFVYVTSAGEDGRIETAKKNCYLGRDRNSYYFRRLCSRKYAHGCSIWCIK